MKYPYSQTFAHTISSTYGARGVQWLAQLHDIIEQCVSLWNLTDLHVVPNLTYNYVLFGKMSAKPVVLKLRCDQKELEKEIAALSVFVGDACVKIISYDFALGVLLLERVMSGDALKLLFPHDDEIATKIAVDLINSLHRVFVPSGVSFPLLKDVLPIFDKEPKELAQFIDHARSVKKQLLLRELTPVLLHGDFHQGNIVSSENQQWKIIDPEGIIGDPLYDVAVYIRNPLKELMQQPNAQHIVVSRIKSFSFYFNYSQQRLLDWVFLQAVSSAYWSIEDGLDPANHVAFLKILCGVKLYDRG